jgi:hypothetical protein
LREEQTLVGWSKKSSRNIAPWQGLGVTRPVCDCQVVWSMHER